MPDAVVIGLAKKVKRGKGKSAPVGTQGADDYDDEDMSLDEIESDAVDEMSTALGGQDMDKDLFKSALKDFVVACIKRQEGGEY